MHVTKKTIIAIEIDELCKLIESDNPNIAIKPRNISSFTVHREFPTERVVRIIIELY